MFPILIILLLAAAFVSWRLEEADKQQSEAQIVVSQNETMQDKNDPEAWPVSVTQEELPYSINLEEGWELNRAARYQDKTYTAEYVKESKKITVYTYQKWSARSWADDITLRYEHVGDSINIDTRTIERCDSNTDNGGFCFAGDGKLNVTVVAEDLSRPGVYVLIEDAVKEDYSDTEVRRLVGQLNSLKLD